MFGNIFLFAAARGGCACGIILNYYSTELLSLTGRLKENYYLLTLNY